MSILRDDAKYKLDCIGSRMKKKFGKEIIAEEYKDTMCSKTRMIAFE